MRKRTSSLPCISVSPKWSPRPAGRDGQARRERGRTAAPFFSTDSCRDCGYFPCREEGKRPIFRSVSSSLLTISLSQARSHLSPFPEKPPKSESGVECLPARLRWVGTRICASRSHHKFLATLILFAHQKKKQEGVVISCHAFFTPAYPQMLCS